MDDWLTTADVARLLGIKEETLRSYRTFSQPGGRYSDRPFPEADGRVGNSLLWKAGRADEIRKWAATRPGKGAGGGRPRGQIHHRDADPRNNDPANLEVREQPEA